MQLNDYFVQLIDFKCRVGYYFTNRFFFECSVVDYFIQVIDCFCSLSDSKSKRGGYFISSLYLFTKAAD